MKKYKLLALSLGLVLLLSLLPVGVFAASDYVEISTASELRELVKNCRLDSWSLDKTVVLKKDIDLGGVAFEPIPSFGGTFEGGGHTISGLYISGGSSAGGLFRYIQTDGLVRELNVEGIVAPEADAETFGGIAGENSGRIINCSFSGSVSGRSEVGGIVGVNGATGFLSGCRSLASVAGEHYTGGIAGRNLGNIFNCTNLGAVNTTNPEISDEELNIDWTHLNSTENVPTHTDTGGIAGFSKGRLDSCTNRGNVGYPHVGYNVGGVVGRQSGFMDRCRNFGTVNGRKDVGGVVGQMEPAIEMQFSSSVIIKLRAEMDVLRQLLDNMIVDFQGSANNVSSILTNAGVYLESAGKSASIIGDAIVGFVDGNISSLNSFAATAAKYIESLGEIVGHMEDCFGHLSAAADELAGFIELLEQSGEEFSEILGYCRHAHEKINEARELISGALTLCKSASGEIAAYFQSLMNGSDGDGSGDGDIVRIPSGDELDELENEIRAGYEEFSTVVQSAMSKVNNAVSLLKGIPEKVESAVKEGIEPALKALTEKDDTPEAMSEALQNALEELSKAGETISTAAGELEIWLINLGRENGSLLEGLGQDFLTEADRMDAALLGLSGQIQKLNEAMNSSANVMGDDLRKINEQFFRVMELFMELLDSSDTEVAIYEDMSEEELFSEKDGKVQNCENRGKVEADVNVGGLVGTMAIEYDLDPEEDISVSGTRGGTFRYFTNAVLLSGINYEEIRAKKDAVGGAVGYMDLGVIYDCENYGAIASTSGDYVGGIAGQSAAAIRNCWSLCSVSGRDYVGGIAGLAFDISSCRSIIRINSTGGWKGVIAGEVLGEAKDNFFVNDELGGIDGISYVGKAEPQEYSDFILLEGLPVQFTDFKLTFVADNITVKSVNFTYGAGLDLSEIPAVPEKNGHVGRWEEHDFNRLRFSSAVRAVYTPYDSVVATEDKVGKRSIVLLEGAFLPGTVPTLSEYESAPERSVEAWTVSVEGSMENSFLVRYLMPEDGHELDIYVLKDGSWYPVSYERESSYLIFDGNGDSVSFAAVEREAGFPIVPVVLCASAVVLIILLILWIRAGKKKKPETVI